MGNIFNQNTVMENQSKIVKVVAENLTRLMRQSLTLNTIAAVAAKSGMGTGTVDRIKKGQLPTSIEKIELLAKAFDISPAALISSGGIAEEGDIYFQETRKIIHIMQNTDNRGREKILSKAIDELLLHNAFLSMTSAQLKSEMSGVGKISQVTNGDQLLGVGKLPRP